MSKTSVIPTHFSLRPYLLFLLLYPFVRKARYFDHVTRSNDVRCLGEGCMSCSLSIYCTFEKGTGNKCPAWTPACDNSACSQYRRGTDAVCGVDSKHTHTHGIVLLPTLEDREERGHVKMLYTCVEGKENGYT